MILLFKANLVGLHLLEVAFGAVELGPVLARVDSKQQVSLFDQVAVLELRRGSCSRKPAT